MTKPTRPSMAALQAFESAARTGSFTRAAAELSVTQGAVSRQIGQLEEQLGVLLFDRVRQRVTLTEVGRRYRDDVRRTLDQLELATGRAMARIDLDTVLTLAVAPTFAAKWLAPRLPAFAAAHPHLSIECLIWLPRAASAIEQFDAAIVLGRPKDGNVYAVPLLESELLPMCSPEYRTAQRIRTPTDLLRVRLLQEVNRPSAWSDWFGAQGIAAAGTIRGPRFELTSMVMEAAVSGLGVALFPACLTCNQSAALIARTVRTTRRDAARSQRRTAANRVRSSDHDQFAHRLRCGRPHLSPEFTCIRKNSGPLRADRGKLIATRTRSEYKRVPGGRSGWASRASRVVGRFGR